MYTIWLESRIPEIPRSGWRSQLRIRWSKLARSWTIVRRKLMWICKREMDASRTRHRLFVAAYGSQRRKTGEWRCSSRQFATWTSRAFASAEPNCHRMLQKSSRVGSQDHRRKGRGACPHLGTTSGLDKGRIRNQEGKGWNTQQLAFRWKNRSNWNPRLNTARSTSPSDACNWELLALSSCHAPMLFIVSTCLALRARQADKMKSRASCPSDLCPK